jgi:hypothetical protein
MIYMAHDGQDLTKLNAPVILDDLLALTAAAPMAGCRPI